MSITINGTTGVSGVDGSSTTPAFQGTDTNTGLFYGTDIVGISTGGSERVRVDASGNVGIGTTSPSVRLHLKGSNFSNAIRWEETGGNNNFYAGPLNSSGDFGIDNNSTSGYTRFVTNSTERMRIDSSGIVLVGTTSNFASGNVQGIAAQASGNASLALNRTTDTGAVARFYQAGTNVGRIEVTGSATSYVTSSDYRLKENIAPMTGALDKVAQLKPVTYTWKLDGSNGQGFIAHELQAVVPECVTGQKDAVNEDGSIDPQGIDTSFLVATLTAAIQEQQTIINDLKARVTALETSNV